MKGYTVNATAGAWRERDIGTLAKGKFADLIVLDLDIFAIDPREIGETEVMMTLLVGDEVHRAKHFDG